MNKQFARQIKMYGNKVFGFEVSKHGMENGYLDYSTLSRIVGDQILNNDIISYTGYENWEIISGNIEEDDDVFQYYIITESGYRFLNEYTDEIVYYHDELDMYVWGITHFGTGWDYVLTDLELI